GGVSGSSGGPGAAGGPGVGGGESPPPPDAAARLVAPLSGSLLSTNQPTFYWQRGTGTGTGALTVELCSDRPCTHIVQQCAATGSSATAPAALAAGHVFWRVRGAAAVSA